MRLKLELKVPISLKNKEKYDYTIKNFDDATGLYKALENGEADAIVDDYPVLGYAVKMAKITISWR